MIHLSETSEGFRAHTSLDDPPYVFDFSWVKGAIFYLPSGAPLGGDAFMVNKSSNITVSLLADMTHHGEIARKRLDPIIPNLKYLTALCAEEFNKEMVAQEIFKLDNQLTFQTLIALSLVRISDQHELHIANGGENSIFISKNKKAYAFANDYSVGKVGTLHLPRKTTPCLEKRTVFYSETLSQGDRLLLCTDGAVDLTEDESGDADLRKSIVRILEQTPGDIKDIVSAVNSYNAERLRQLRKERPFDDYTVIAVEMK